MSRPADAPPTFLRPRDGRMIAGVCAALARRWRLDASLVRGLFALLGLAGLGLVLYPILWAAIPEE